jgi:hypothetical protein
MISIGLPARRHCAVVPTPPWCTTSDARGNSFEYGAYSATQIESGSSSLRPVPRVRPDQQHRAHAQLLRRLRRLLIKISRRQHRRRSQRKHHRRVARARNFSSCSGSAAFPASAS